ncbi:Transcriptional regulator IclR family [Paraburkholderia piptadeniae]|uniref:Transcriptional regulator IclR family n=1 Tax=Paraburkholderia piptadeniae TaxID=1701573 RepID=A0A1N7RWA2_9BURK|nr:IclR family transcriptional regulator [Paraburkholderia piptadeniae]SIT39043.1 Transcriptional regulator IclR family [Paraburkholderia piptadeniae]
MTTPDTSQEHKLLRLLRLLERVSASSEPVTIAQIAMRLEIPKASAARLVDMLVSDRYLSRMPDARGLVPGPRSVQLASTTLSNSSFRRTCRAILRGVVEKLGETCNLSALDGDRVLYLERVETPEPLRMHLDLGSRHPLHCTAGGKLFLSQMPLVERSALLDRMIFTKRTPHTITSRASLDDELLRLAEKGIGIEREEFVVGMVGLAVPVVTGGAGNAIALVCHAASARSSLEHLLTKLPILKEASVQFRELFEAET